MVNCAVQLFSDDLKESHRYHIYTAAVKSNLGIEISRMGANLVFPITNAQKKVQLHFLDLLKILRVKTTANLNSLQFGQVIQPVFSLDSFSLLNLIIPTEPLPTKGLQQQLDFHGVRCNESQRGKKRING